MIKKQIFVNKKDIAQLLSKLIIDDIVIRVIKTKGNTITNVKNINNQEYTPMEIEDLANMFKEILNNTKVLGSINPTDIVELENPN